MLKGCNRPGAPTALPSRFLGGTVFVFVFNSALKVALAVVAIVPVVLFQAPSIAQKKNSGAAPSDQQLKKQFRDGFVKGCLQGKTPGVKRQSSYCNCLANSYQARYDGKILTAISQAAGQLGEQGPALVNLMMLPESKSCASRS